jgi:hypothetical protein
VDLEGVQRKRAGEAHQRLGHVALGQRVERRVQVTRSGSARASGQPR